ncbi:MAG: DUF2384 domain-containing protein [Sphingopyxis sp.]|uniref:Uncharacterized protein n=1 Tax=uncultured Sphingopyxis sp. TaxID=310581 RepID=A0A1Y5PY44_9SPHN|nr:antitoxin Xre/MbcA/ParS toxin-binding domain-containing protein [Sphingopyxis sp.]MBJ7499804.1 DUF2384 domain-containing protein [Sphingopyxis sp.]SBV32417.1 protein of unknown function [uncultured Sphingopyxis sp.]
MPPDSDQPQSPAPDTPAPANAQSRRFFRKSRRPFALDDARRQGDISQLAFLTMGGRDPAIAFLNTDNAALGGRPLTVATASPEGYERVAAAIRRWPSGPGFK